MSEVQRWAEFSNDFNPIHFDLQQAQSAGLDELIVHGMLALMPVKVAVVEAYAALESNRANASGRWMKFHALFRSPIPHDEANKLTLHPSRNNGVDFKLHAGGTQQERFRGGFSPTTDRSDWLRERPLPAASFSALRLADAEHFAKSYPHVQEGWITLDAIVFSDFMRCGLAYIAEAVQKELEKLAGNDSASGLFVQASHTVYIDTKALGSPGALPIPCDQLSYAMCAPEVVINSDKLIGSVSLPVAHGQNLIMLIEIGLLAKPSVKHQ